MPNVIPEIDEVPAESDCFHERPPFRVLHTRPAVSSRKPTCDPVNDTWWTRVVFVGSFTDLQLWPLFVEESTRLPLEPHAKIAVPPMSAFVIDVCDTSLPGTELNSPPPVERLMPFGPNSRTLSEPGTAMTARGAPPAPALSVCHVRPPFCVRNRPPRMSRA